MAILDPGNLIVCGSDIRPAANHPCGYADLIKLAQVIINDLIVIASFLATAVFVYAGIKLLTSGGDPGAMKDAKDLFKKVLLGYLWIIAAWFIIYLISKALLNPGYSILSTP